MKRILMRVALVALPAWMAACSDNDDEKTPEGDGDGDGPSSCSSDELDVPAGGAGGAGGAPAISCEMPSAPESKIEIAGSYTDQFDSSFDASTTKIDLGYAEYVLSIVDNEANYVVARNAETDMYNPCAWSTFVWTETDEGLFYCQSVYGATSECEAENAERPDPTDLETGCSGFSWSQLTEN